MEQKPKRAKAKARKSALTSESDRLDKELASKPPEPKFKAQKAEPAKPQTPARKPEELKPAKKEEPKPAPPKQKKSSNELEPWEEQVREHLQYLCDMGECQVIQFQRHTDLGASAITFLRNLVNEGMVNREWRDSAGRYSLTKKGHSHLHMLNERAGYAGN